jgi:hypothetical protein
MGAVTANVQPQMVRTPSAFASGVTIHLRKDGWKSAPMVRVTSQGIVQDNPCMLSLQWNEDAAKGFGRPQEGEKYTCHSMARGVLYVAVGEIAEIATGQLPRIRLRMQDPCLALSLRQHQRYLVLRQGELADLADMKTTSSKIPRPLDLSLGGFSFEVGEAGWEVGEQARFNLELFVDQSGQPRRDLPSLQLTGLASVRSIFRLDGVGKVRLGCQFCDLAADQREQLEFWLTVHNCFLRNA